MQQPRRLRFLSRPILLAGVLTLTLTLVALPESALAADCNGNAIADVEDIDSGESIDCNEDGIPDECQLENRDCNQSGSLDLCDILDGSSLDCNQNGPVPTESASR